MPWFHCEAELISRKEIESLCARLLEEARARLGRDFQASPAASSGSDPRTQWFRMDYGNSLPAPGGNL